VEFYADAEGGIRLPNPTRADLIGLIDDLNDSENTFVVVHPPVDEADWFFSVSKNVGAFGGYELHRYDPETDERVKTTAAAPTAIADDVLDWISRR
jgi:hypothetical protein